MQLNLTDAETEALIRAIDSYCSNLHSEIYHTDNYTMREDLKAQSRALDQVRDKLEPGWLARRGIPAAPPAPPPT
jgi:hypothetical protein